MELDEESNEYPGSLPEYGAIFLSNTATKKECLRRKVFGLPPSRCSFVNQIKAGMILFLFEYEKRELYGVFQACSDGAMNIAPHVFSSLGKHCPAQVKITLLWNCSPLSEKEFRDAIKGNYYSAKKFNLGLSEVQVKRLLQLFSLRKLEDPQRQVSRNKYAKKIVHSTGKPSQVDDGRGVGNNSVNEQHDSVITNQPAIQKAHQGYSSCRIGRVSGTEDNRSSKNVWVRNHCEKNSELRMGIRNVYSGDISGKTRRDKDKFGSCKRTWNESDVDIYLGSADTTDYPISDKVGRDGDEFVMSRLIRNEHCMNTDLGKALSANYLGYPFEEVRRIPVADRLSMSEKFQNEGIDDNCFGAGVLTEHPSSIQSDLHTSIFSRKQRLVANPNSLVPDNVKSSFTVGHQMGQQPSCLPHTSSYDVMAANSLVPNETNSTFTFGHQTGQQPSNLPYATSYDDATVVSTLPHNSDAYSLGHQLSSLNKVNNSFSFEKCRTHYDYGENVTSRNQPYSLHTEPEGMNQRLDQISRFRDHISSTRPVHIEESCHGTGMALPQAVYSEDLNANSLRNQCYGGLPSSMFTLEHVPLDRQWGLTGSSSSGPTSYLVPLQTGGTRICARGNKFPSASSYHHSLSVYPSLEDDFGHLVAPEDQLEHRTAWREENKVPTGRIPLSDEDQFEMQGNFYEDDSFKYELEHSQKSDRLNLGRQKSRSSVFSRLALASDIYSPETNSYTDCEASTMSTSVDEVMGMLHKNCHEWVKLKKSKQWCKQNDVEDLKSKKQTSISLKSVHGSNDDAEGLKKKKRTSISLKSVHGSCKQIDDAEDLKKIKRTTGLLESVQGCCKQNDAAGDLKKKKPTSVSLKSEQGCLKLVAKDVKEGRPPVGEEREAQLTESTSFLNFRRRSETWKVNDKSSDESAGNDGLLAGQRKKRKLVRPSFSKNDSFDDIGTNRCASLALNISALENSVSKDITGGSEALIGSQENRTKVRSQVVKVGMVSLLHNEDGNPNTERRERRVESDIGVKELSDRFGLQNAKIPVTCEDQNPDTVMDSVCNDIAGSGLSQASHMTSHSVVLEVSMQVLKANAENGDKHSEPELLPSAHSVDPAAIRANQNSESKTDAEQHLTLCVDHNSESQTEAEQHSAICVDQNDGDKNSELELIPSDYSIDPAAIGANQNSKSKRDSEKHPTVCVDLNSESKTEAELLAICADQSSASVAEAEQRVARCADQNSESKKEAEQHSAVCVDQNSETKTGAEKHPAICVDSNSESKTGAKQHLAICVDQNSE